jgi:hypothetical protein
MILVTIFHAHRFFAAFYCAIMDIMLCCGLLGISANLDILICQNSQRRTPNTDSTVRAHFPRYILEAKQDIRSAAQRGRGGGLEGRLQAPPFVAF